MLICNNEAKCGDFAVLNISGRMPKNLSHFSSHPAHKLIIVHSITRYIIKLIHLTFQNIVIIFLLKKEFLQNSDKGCFVQQWNVMKELAEK
jgi:hypothetical protein